MKHFFVQLKNISLFFVIAMTGLAGCDRENGAASDIGPWHTVGREDISERVLVAGTIRPTDIEVLRNNVGNGSPSKSMMAMGFKPENPTLIYMIPEGSKVQEGDILWEVQSDNLELIRYEREFQLSSSQATLVKWNERLEIEKLQATSWTMDAQKYLRFAQQDLTKYIEADAPLQLQKLKDTVTRTLNRSNQANGEHLQSIKLQANGYITHTELEADKLLDEERQASKELAQASLALFEQYTYPRQIFMYERNIEFAKINLYKAQIWSASSIANAQRLANFFEMDHQMRTERLEYINEQIADSKTYAPMAGTVIYAASNGRGRIISGYSPLELGDKVSMKEHVVHLFSSDRMHLAVKLMEMELSRVKVGQEVHITAETFDDRTYLGVVSDIALLATQESAHTHPDLYQYKATIDLVGPTDGLHPGMNCIGEIISNKSKDVLTVPNQSITERVDSVTGERRHVVYAKDANGFNAKTVTLGLRNPISAEITSGVIAGEQVLLGVPALEHLDTTPHLDPWIQENLNQARRGRGPNAVAAEELQ